MDFHADPTEENRRLFNEASQEYMDFRDRPAIPEVCVGCGSYFGYRGGDQLCVSCCKL